MRITQLGKLTLLGITLLGPTTLVQPAAAQVSVHVGVGIPLPPPLVLPAPPQVIVLPGTYAYVAPDVSDDLYFVDGWWWRPWQGRWYRSHYYDRGWAHYSSVPSFYVNINHGWRDEYRNRLWHGQQWDYERIPHDRVEKNWKSWKTNDHWKKDKSWGVKDYKGAGHGPKGVPRAATNPKHGGPAPKAASQKHGGPAPKGGNSDKGGHGEKGEKGGKGK